MSTLAGFYAGVDTHLDQHTVAVTDSVGTVQATAGFEATPIGYQQIRRWICSFGEIIAVGVEGTGAYGAGLSRYLAEHDLVVCEVIRPNRQHRRRHGKSDESDAIAAARAVISGEAAGRPRGGTGPVESLRALRTARNSAIKHRTAVANQLHALIATAPEPLRTHLRVLNIPQVVARARRYHTPTDPTDPTAGTKAALRSLARRWNALTNEISELDELITPLVAATSRPGLLAEPGVGTNTAATLIITVGSNPERIRSEAAFAALCGVSPVDASSGLQQRHRLNRGGDRQANAALHQIVIVRLRYHQPTRDYMTRRLQEGKTKKEIIRCLKRHLARQLYQHLKPTT